MTKNKIKEILRETIRQERIKRDNGVNVNDAHDRIQHLTFLLQRCAALTGKAELNSFADTYGIE